MDKVSEEDVLKAAAEAPGVIRALVAERDAAVSKVAQLELRRDAEKLAEAMHDKGLSTEIPLSDLADQLEKAASKGKFEEIKRAVDLVGPDMGQKIAQVSNSDEPSGSHSGGMDPLTSFLIG